jgi:hypothetical protein
MPIELDLDDDTTHEFNKMSEIPKEFNSKVISFVAIEMNIKSVLNIGLRFPNLVSLNVCCNKIRILDLSYFHNLKYLQCTKNKIREIIGFEYCHKLEEVDISCNIIHNIKRNNNLKRLAIGQNYLEELPDFNNLKVLSILCNKYLKSLGNYPKLTNLYINNTSITSLKLYMNLVVLECSNTSISNLPPYPLLEELEIINCPLNKNNLPYLPSIVTIIDKKLEYID